VPVVEMSVLHALPMFAALPPLELEAVARSAEHIDVATDEVVIQEGDVGDRFYAVAAGSFSIVMRGEHVRDARRGSCFGEVALLADVPRTATVSATEPGRLLAVERAPFLVAMTGRDSALSAAWDFVQTMPVASELPEGPTVTPER
jgi:CRP-like cAMP-binding protein